MTKSKSSFKPAAFSALNTTISNLTLVLLLYRIQGGAKNAQTSTNHDEPQELLTLISKMKSSNQSQNSSKREDD